MVIEGFAEYEVLNMDIDTNADVLVECFSYNEKEYIADALEGIVHQNVSFRYIVLVIDDASDDGTSDIIRTYAERYSNNIVAFIAKENTFGRRGRKEAYKYIQKKYLGSARYIATCEADDYWTDNNKLQIQYEYMESHPDCMMYIHNCIWSDYSKNEEKVADVFETDSERDLKFDEVAFMKKGYPATASRLYRRELLEAPNFVRNCSVGDYNLMLYAMTQGKVHYSKRVMCVYRYMRPGSTANFFTRNEIQYQFYHRLGILIFLMELDEYTSFKYHDVLAVQIRTYFNALVRIIGDGDFIDSYNRMKESFYLDIPDDKLQICEDYMPDDLRKFIANEKKLYVFGAGKYAKKMTLKLQHNGYEFEGYLVSNVQDNNELLGKKIWNLTNPPMNDDEFGLIVAVVPKESDCVRSVIESAQIRSVIYPYDIHF